MSRRAWFAAVVLAGIFGGIGGWSARVLTTQHLKDRAELQAFRVREHYYLSQGETILAEQKTKLEGTKDGNRNHAGH